MTGGAMGMAITAITIAAMVHALEGAQSLVLTRRPKGAAFYFV